MLPDRDPTSLRGLNVALCEALGVTEPGRVAKLTLTIAPNRLPKLIVERWVTPNGAAREMVCEVTKLQLEAKALPEPAVKGAGDAAK